jgi:uncharacterized membrane protein YkvA (DUF1232 family)
VKKIVSEKWKTRAYRLKTEVYALYLAYQDPRVSRTTRLFTACVVAYALSPIDLIPDFIPIIGYLDDIILVPLGIALAIKMMPPGVMDDARIRASRDLGQNKIVSRTAAAVIIVIWSILSVLLIGALIRMLSV